MASHRPARVPLSFRDLQCQLPGGDLGLTRVKQAQSRQVRLGVRARLDEVREARLASVKLLIR
jgi:hypothetical protein